ncbi:MAG: right-handed parallel beta-helix repeat-containing protein [Alphaproteobacteria bacterium]|nr:right-handed parallel beta-helix repeat-containing protein [Alphaproteobacteria bacterium]
MQATPAFAQATRTWVSGVGDDVNPCSRTAPCKTFAGAISKTAAGGEINCLDPAGYGAVTINKSLVIDCHFTEGGVLASGNGIVINAAATDTIVLRGLDIFGVSPPTNGIRILVAGAVHIEDCVIRRFNAANSDGISVAPTVALKLYINDTRISENGNGATGGGIELIPGVGGSVNASLQNVHLMNNANNGLRVDSTNGQVAVEMQDGQVSGSTQGVSVNGGASAAGLMLNNVTITGNSSVGIVAVNATANLRVDNSTITANALGVLTGSGASIFSYGHNRLDNNPNGGTNNGAFTGAIIPTK